MTVDEQLRARLIELKGDRPMRKVAEETGLGLANLYAIVSGERSVGMRTIETLRQTRPDLLEGLFLPCDSQIGEIHSQVVEQ